MDSFRYLIFRERGVAWARKHKNLRHLLLTYLKRNELCTRKSNNPGVSKGTVNAAPIFPSDGATRWQRGNVPRGTPQPLEYAAEAGDVPRGTTTRGFTNKARLELPSECGKR